MSRNRIGSLLLSAALLLSPAAPLRSQDLPPADAAGAPLPQGDSAADPLVPTLPATEAGPAVLSLAEAVLAAAGNEDASILAANLGLARAQHAVNAAKAQPGLSGAATWALSDGLGDAAQARSAGAGGLGIGQSFGASLGFSEGTATPSSGTRINLSLAQNYPASPQPRSTGSGQVAVPPSTQVSATLSQAVWDGYLGGQTKAAVDKSALALQGKELSSRQAKSQALARVKQAYIATLVAQRALALRLGILDKQNSLLSQIEATYALKQASAIDLETARINARAAELDVEAGRHDFALARQRLAGLLGMPPDADFRVAEIEVPALPAASLDDAIAAGLANRVDIAQLEVARRSSAIDLALAKGAAQPTVTATGSIGASWNWGAPPAEGVAAVPAASGQSVGLGLKVAAPILDGGAAAAQEASARAAMDAAASQAAQLRKGVAADIRDAWWNLQILAKRGELAKRSLELARSQLALVRQQLEFGTATNQDLMTATVSAANAEAAWLQSKSGQLLAELALETAMGL